MGIMKLLRIGEIAGKEGLRTLNHVLREKYQNHISDVDRYEAYIRNTEPELKKRWTGVDPEYDVSLKLYTVEQLKDNIQHIDEMLSEEYVGVVESESLVYDEDLAQIKCFIMNLRKHGDNADFLYTDEDVIENGHRILPVFKQEYSENTLLSFNYIGGMWIARTSLALKPIKEVFGDADISNCNSREISYRIAMNILVGKNLRVKHVNQVMYHNHERCEKDYSEGLKKYKERLLQSRGIKACVADDARLEVKGNRAVNHIYYEVPENIVVSIVIPSKDNPAILKKCLDSISRYTTMTQYEIIVVDNGSTEDNREKYKQIISDINSPSEYIYRKMPFNFSHMCNIGAQKASGSFILFLNDDIEIIKQGFGPHINKEYDWLKVMVGQAMQSNTGAVGARLLYPDSDKIQHIGVVNYEIGGLVHLYAAQQDDIETIKQYRNTADYSMLCVTGACLMIDKKRFYEMNAFDEQLQITHNDIDLCMKLYEKGYEQVIRNDVVLIHHESFSRGTDEENDEKRVRSLKERDRLFTMHPELENYDPYYSASLSQNENNYRIAADYGRILYKKPEREDPEIINSYRKLSGTGCNLAVTSANYKEDLQISGYAYNDRKALNVNIYLYNDDNCYRVVTQRLCDRVYHERKGIKHHINYALFRACVDTSAIMPGDYSVGVLIPGKQWLEYNDAVNIRRKVINE